MTYMAKFSDAEVCFTIQVPGFVYATVIHIREELINISLPESLLSQSERMAKGVRTQI